MNQIMIKVMLTVLGEEDVLIFYLDDEHPEEYVIKLNSATNQADIKKVFSKILQLVLENDIALDYSVAEGYTKGLYKEVCKEYIEDLQNEINNAREQIITELK